MADGTASSYHDILLRILYYQVCFCTYDMGAALLCLACFWVGKQGGVRHTVGQMKEIYVDSAVESRSMPVSFMPSRRSCVAGLNTEHSLLHPATAVAKKNALIFFSCVLSGLRSDGMLFCYPQDVIRAPRTDEGPLPREGVCLGVVGAVHEQQQWQVATVAGMGAGAGGGEREGRGGVWKKGWERWGGHH